MMKYRNRKCPTIICCIVSTSGGTYQFCNIILVVTIHNILIIYHESNANRTMSLSRNTTNGDVVVDDDVVVVLL